MPFYKREFLGVNLASLPAATKVEPHPVGPELWEQLYAQVNEERDQVDGSWQFAKTDYGNRLLTDIIVPWEFRHGRKPRILSVSVGLGVAEEEWLKAGYDVTLHECQHESLEDIHRRYPTAPLLYGDLRDVVFEEKYDIIAILSVEAVLNAEEVVSFLQRLSGPLSDDGVIIIDSASVLSLRQLAAESIKRVTGYYRKPYVFWAWWRTPGFLAGLARKAGLDVEAIYNVHRTNGRRRLHRRARLYEGWPTLRTSHAALVLRSSTKAA